MKLPTADTTPGPTVHKDYRNDMACWRNFCQDLIYAGAYGAESYLREVERRKAIRNDAERQRILDAGRQLCERLEIDYPDEVRLRRAQAAWANPVAVLARYSRWLPKRPDGEVAIAKKERERRSGITDEQRQRNADQLAAIL